MQLITVLMVAFSLQVSAVGLSQTVTFSGSNVPLKKAFLAIKRQTGYVVFYNYDLLEEASPVTINMEDAPLVTFLEKLFQDQPFHFLIKDRNIVITRKPPPVKEQAPLVETIAEPPILIKGRVVNSTGAPMAGVSVTLKGSSIGTFTGDDGRYNLNIPGELAEKVVVFSYVDYQSQEVRITNRYTIDVTLDPNDRSLGEIVVVGYSAIRKEGITGSVGSISAEKLNDATSPNIASLLQGKVAGVDVVSGGGKPGRLATVNIRGQASISTSLVPLWVVDGVIAPEDPNLNPEDVESITVLKDASAASLYGSRAANGVIVVTTKSAKGVDRKDLVVSTRLSLSKYNPGKFEVMNAKELVDFYKSFTNPSAIPSWFNESLGDKSYNWVDLITKDAMGQEYNISYSGTTGKARIYAAGNYYTEDGTVKDYIYDRYSARLNIDYPLNDKITFSPKISTSFTKIDNRQHTLYQAYVMMPWDNPFDEDGNAIDPQAPGTLWYGRDLRNEMYDLQWNYKNEDRFNISSNFDLKYQITKNFAFKSTNNVTYYNVLSLGYEDPKSVAGRADVGHVIQGNIRRITRFTNQMITYSGKSGLHELNALAAYEFNDFKLSNFTATGKGIVPGISVLDGTASPISAKGNTTEYAFRSYLFNANYGYDNDRFVGQFSFRRDGSSRFGSNKKYGNFWSVSGAWNIHREAFFQSKSIDYLRLKAAYGGVGNTPNAFYPQYDLYAVNVQYNGSPTAVPASLGNPDLTWEKTYSTNIGADIGLFKRIDLSIEWYNKNTSDLLYLVPLPAVSGYTGKWENIGAVTNKGFELSIGGDVVKTPNFNWRIDVNVGAYKNRIKELYKGNSQIVGWFIYTVGQDINTFYLRKWAGVNPDNGAPQWEIVDPNTKEVTLTSNYSAATLQNVGTTTPDYYGGASTNITYKALSLRATFAFREGGYGLPDATFGYDSDGAYPAYNQKRLLPGESRWTPENRNATHPAPAYGGNLNSHNYSSRLLKNTSFFRMRNITIGYSLPQLLVSRLKLKGIDAFLSGDNLFIVTPYFGMDPESAVISNNDSTDPYSYYPNPKKYTFGLNIHL